MTKSTLTSTGWVIVFIILVTGLVFGASQWLAIHNIASIRASWHQFDVNRSEQRRAINALRRELGYGGMIHSLKNLVLRGDQDLVKEVEYRLGGAFAQISWYRDLAPGVEEQAALDDIEATLYAYEQKLPLIQRMQLFGRSAEQIDELVRVDDQLALSGLYLLDQKITQAQRGIESASSKPMLISRLRQHMGYGGMIHDFKNFVLRRTPEYRKRVENDVRLVQQDIDQYMALPINAAERGALERIQSDMDAYLVMLPVVTNLAETGASTKEIDQFVNLDESPVVEAFNILNREVIALDAANARHMVAAMDHVERVAVLALSAAIVLVLVLVVLSIWLIRYRIVLPIARMTQVMTRLAGGELEISVPRAGRSDEIGAMAWSIEVFRRTAIARDQAERRLREQEKRYRLILNQAAEGIVTVDADGLIELFNPAAEQIFGFRAAEVLGENINNLITNPVSRGLGDFVRDFVEGGEPVDRREFVGLRRDGGQVPIEVAISTLELGNRTLYTGVVSDITLRKQAESLKNEFISTVSHELRTPLTSIKGALAIVESGRIADDAKRNNLISVAARNTERLITLVNDLLDIEKLQAGKMDFTPAEINLGALAQRVLEANQPFAQQYGVRLQLLDMTDGAVILGDSDRLTQVLVNLISNAVKFSPEEGLVNISIERIHDGVRVSVADHGPGIPSGFRDRIFDRFSQADGSDTRRRGGTGLGLSISRTIVERHGGKLDFESQEGVGSIFYFELPEMRFEPPEAMGGQFNAETPGTGHDDAPVTDGGPDVTDSSLRHHRRILFVEDDPDLRDLLVEMIGGSMSIDCAGTLRQAHALLEERTYDLAVVDPGLPDGNGLDLLPNLKDAKGSPLPVIIYSSQAHNLSIGSRVARVLVKSRHGMVELMTAIDNIMLDPAASDGEKQ